MHIAILFFFSRLKIVFLSNCSTISQFVLQIFKTFFPHNWILSTKKINYFENLYLIIHRGCRQLLYKAITCLNHSMTMLSGKEKIPKITPYVCNSSLGKNLYIIKYSPHCEKCLRKDPFNKDLHTNQGATFKAEAKHFVILPGFVFDPFTEVNTCVGSHV